MMRKKKTSKLGKGDQTKALILETALEMFRERGYDETTMRAVAQKAGVSLGNAYYYFRSKEYLIQAFYQRLHESHLEVVLPALENEKTLKARLLTVVRTKIETMEPYHQFAGVLFKTAAHPQSPLNPFADETDPVRQASIQLFDLVLAGTKARIPNDLRAELPYLLWVYHMGIVLFWIHDSSPKHRRTYRLINHTVDLLDKLIHLASNPFMRPLRKQALRLLDELRDAAESVDNEPAETASS
ncbi:MAG TPA: TetR family transcriptional regulator [Pyrinomonadaceae bacterium]|jgi:AcrR family transcriptional regulator|nr:TetR family transcriptional regulator [Pyrinomonadaceae bacterium]